MAEKAALEAVRRETEGVLARQVGNDGNGRGSRSRRAGRGIMEEEDSETVEEEEGLAIAEVEEDFKIVAKEEEMGAATVNEEAINTTEEGNARAATGDVEEEVDITIGEEG